LKGPPQIPRNGLALAYTLTRTLLPTHRGNLGRKATIHSLLTHAFNANLYRLINPFMSLPADTERLSVKIRVSAIINRMVAPFALKG